MAYSLLLSDEFSEEEFLEARAKYNAHSAIFGIQFSDKEVKEKLKERKRLEAYARENNLYPSDYEIENYINEIVDSFKDVDYEIKDGIIEGLGITEEKFFHKFLRDEYVSSLVRLNIIN